MDISTPTALRVGKTPLLVPKNMIDDSGLTSVSRPIKLRTTPNTADAKKISSKGITKKYPKINFSESLLGERHVTEPSMITRKDGQKSVRRTIFLANYFEEPTLKVPPKKSVLSLSDKYYFEVTRAHHIIIITETKDVWWSRWRVVSGEIVSFGKDVRLPEFIKDLTQT